ncbi:glycan-binding surface protein [Terrimonas pollutisoli]|uniref:glycan-binding surface protein n=1 Tax=Terrimonas pollutisoli TaxID=3034147 RepID=UPI0023ED80A3|nr:glycan-binding surface protein [Terrimonas sp. H1YJ31]
MNKILNHRFYLPLLIIIVALLSACKKDISDDTPPVITEVRSYAADPNDTVINGLTVNDQIRDGQWVVISGQNLKNAIQIKFNGVNASFNSALFAQNNAVVRIPTILFSTIDTTKLYTIEYATTGGTTTFAFKLGPAAPTISAISNVFANPGDSVFIYGTNLVLVQSFSYGGTKISSSKTNTEGTSLGFVMPSPAPTSGDIVVTTKSGTVTYKISATPTITGVSNENAIAGDSVFVYGTYFKKIQTFTFAGATITSFNASADGSSIGFVMPSISTSGPVSITTPFGTATTVYNVNDIVGVGSISNWEWGSNFNWQWWGGSNLTSGSPDFPGNQSQYQVLKRGIFSSGEGNTWSSYAIRMNAVQWVPTASMNDPIDNWAFKFEVNIPQEWNGPSILIQSSDATYTCRLEPWQKSATTTAPYTTKGWQTITIPFSAFRKTDATLGDGRGASMTKFADLLGTSGNSECYLWLKNFSTSDTPTGFYGAFDNLRVVKIK